MTAVLAAASGNVAAGAGQFVQAATVNYLQALGAEEIKALAKHMGGEGSPAHIALHSILACGGAAAQGANCGAGAIGAASSIVIEKLASELTKRPSDALNNEEREQRKNTILNVIVGIGAALDPRHAPTAMTAARIELDNNSMLSVQEHQARIQETMQCKGVKACEQRVTEKYATVSQQRRQSVLQCKGVADCLNQSQKVRDLATTYSQRSDELAERHRLQSDNPDNDSSPWNWADFQEWAVLKAELPLMLHDQFATSTRAGEDGSSDKVKEVVWQELAKAGIASAAGVAAGHIGATSGAKTSAGGTGANVRTAVTARPTHRQSEVDVGTELGSGARFQVSYKSGHEVPYGTRGSVRPDWCVGNMCGIEVKNYNVATNQQGLVNNISRQALHRAENLPTGMQQQVIIDIRGQVVSVMQKNTIIKDIVRKSNGILKPTDIRFKE